MRTPNHPPFAERTQSKSSGALRVTVGVPTPAEAEAIYGRDLTRRGIQPIWVEVENDGPAVYWMLETGLDSDNFSISEVAYAFDESEGGDAGLEGTLDALRFKNPVGPGQTVGGFVLTNIDEGLKAVDVDLVTRGGSETFSFNVADPTAELTSGQVDFDALYQPGGLIQIEGEGALRAALEQLPCCTTNRQGNALGDPLNLVLVGEQEAITSAFLRRGWRPTETRNPGSIWRTVESFIGRLRYRSSPISPLYVFGRPQDGAIQKARATIRQRNHARFWMTAIRYRGVPVWIGQTSRDIGVKYTLRSPTISTHVIDPDVDEARFYFLEDMAYSQALEEFGHVAGVGTANRQAPRFNLVGDPYYTDGLRAVLFVGVAPRSLDQIDWLDWESAGRRSARAARNE